jgi:hypothetical protein
MMVGANERERMSSRFKYNTQTLDRKMYRGRRIPVTVVSVVEKVRGEKRNRPVPSLIITYQPPDGALEQCEYEGGEDCIPSNSPLGRLIKTCSNKLRLDDLGGEEGDFKPITGKHLWVVVEPVKQSGGIVHFRWPEAWMTEAEIADHFQLLPPFHFLAGKEQIIEDAFDGYDTGSLIPVVASHSTLRQHMKEVALGIEDGTLFPWLEQHTALRIQEDENGFKTLKKEVTVN